MPAPAAPSSRREGYTRAERSLLAALAAVQFTSIVDFMIVMPLGPQLVESLGIDTVRFGWIVSSYTFAAGAAGLAAALILDRVDRRTAFLLLALGFAAGTFLCGLADGYATLLAARTMTGAFGGLLGGQSLAIVGDVFPEARRGRATGTLMSGFALASVAGVPAGIWIGDAWGWRAAFLVLAAASLPTIALAFRVIPPLRSHAARPREPALPRLIETLTLPAHRRAFALVSVLMVGAFAVIPFISASFVANVGVRTEELPIVYVAGGLVTLVGSPWIGRLADRHGKWEVFRGVVPVSAAMMVVISHLPRVGVWYAAVVTAVLMLANTGRMVAAMALVTAAVEPARRAGFMAVNSSIQHVACGIGTAIGAAIAGGDPGEPLAAYGLAGWFAAAVTMASLWFAGRLRPPSAGPATDASRGLAPGAEAAVSAGEGLHVIDGG
ncbi:MAG: MFS transporter [Planctomycetaceae bacterium]